MSIFQPSEKKVHLIRNRSLSILSDSDLKENNKTEEETNDKNKEETDNEPVKIAIKLSQSEEEVRSLQVFLTSFIRAPKSKIFRIIFFRD